MFHVKHRLFLYRKVLQTCLYNKKANWPGSHSCKTEVCRKYDPPPAENPAKSDSIKYHNVRKFKEKSKKEKHENKKNYLYK